MDGMGDWFASYGPHANIANAVHFPSHMGGMGVSFGPDSAQINMSTMEGLGDIFDMPLSAVAIPPQVAPSYGSSFFHDSHELQIPDWLKYAGGGLALLLVLKMLSKKK